MQNSDGRSGGAALSDAKRALLAKRLRGDAAGTARPRDVITRRELAGPPPLSFAQERMWVLDQLEPGEHRLQHRGGVVHGGAAGRGRAGADPPRDPAAARGAAHLLSRRGRRAGAGVSRPVLVPGGDGGGPGDDGGRARRLPAPPHPRGGDAPLRPGDRAALPRAPVPPVPRAARLPDHQAPHRHRRVEHGRAHPRAGGHLQGLRPRRAVAAPRAAHPVPRLRGVAARVPDGRDAAAPGGLLEGAPGRRPQPGAAHRPAAPARGEPPRRLPPLPGPRGGHRRAERPQPARGRHPQHDHHRRLGDPPGPVLGAGRLRHGDADRQPQPRGDGGADRLLRQHRGAADGPVGRSHLPRAAAAGARHPAGRRRAPGPPVRPGGGGAAAPARPEPAPRLPGDVLFARVRRAERAHAEPRPGRRELRPVRPGERRRPAGHRRGQVRPGAGDAGAGRGPHLGPGVRHRPVRRGHRPGDRGPPGGPPRLRRRRPGRLRVGPAHGARRGAGRAGCPRRRPPGPPRGGDGAGAVPGPGRAHPRRHRGPLGGRFPHLRRAGRAGGAAGGAPPRARRRPRRPGGRRAGALAGAARRHARGVEGRRASTSRSTRRIPASASPSCSPTPRRRSW